MSHDRLIQFVTRQLDASLTNIPQGHRERLTQARNEAVTRHAHRSESRFAGLAGVFHIDFLARRALIRVASLLVLSLGISYWHAQHYIVGLEEVDSAILTDEMPMDVITDKGFDAWLKSSVAR